MHISTWKCSELRGRKREGRGTGYLYKRHETPGTEREGRGRREALNTAEPRMGSHLKLHLSSEVKTMTRHPHVLSQLQSTKAA